MPIHGYPGNVITANPTAPTVSSASGVWTTEQQLQAVSQGNWPGYEYPLANSLRFNSADSAYLNRTFTTPTDGKRWTYSFWIKRVSFATNQPVLTAYTDANNQATLYHTTGNKLYWLSTTGGTTYTQFRTDAVYRDASAWYHFVVVFDSTNATSTDRIKMYVNGTSLTCEAGQYIAPGLNTTAFVNTAIGHRIGNDQNLGIYLNGYLTEVNFIDGQALDPSSFGLNDPETGVWSPKRYTGTYGTNGFYLPMTTEGQWSGYFDGTGDKLTSSTNAIAATGQFSVEAWVYQIARTVTSDQHIFSQYTSGATSGRWYLRFNGTVISFTSGLGSVNGATTVNTGTWYHVCVTRDSGDRIRVFLNGVLDGTAVVSGSLDTAASVIGATQTANYWHGYISNVRAVSGEIPTAYQTASTTVGATIFTPSTSQLTAVSGTSLLTCQSSTFIDNSGLGRTITTAGDVITQQFSPFADAIDDRSGQGNHWIPNNLDLRTTGVGADIMVDSPTSYGTDTGVGGTVRGNYATLNPLSNLGSTFTFTNGNLDCLLSAGDKAVPSTMLVSSGKWYCEMTITAVGSGGSSVGLIPTIYAASAQIGNSTDSYAYRSSGNKRTNSTDSAYGASYTTNDVIGIALDLDAGTLVFYKNGTTQGTAFSSISGTFAFAFSSTSSGSTTSVTANFGQRAFAYTAPSGFKALCTQNLPTPTIGATSTTQAGKYFGIKTYTGNNSTNAQTGLGFQPDMLWFKSRSGAFQHGVFDAVRGPTKGLEITTQVELTSGSNQDLVSFDNDGFTLGSVWNFNSVNGNALSQVAWAWKANGAGSTNTAGTITSTVSASTTSGFSIVTYTGNGTSGATIGHGLGVAPDMIIIKNRTTSGADWPVYHISRGNTGALYLNTTAAFATDSTRWNNTSPTSTVFSVGNGQGVNQSGVSMLAYCFDAVAGYSAFGSYTGNGSTDGPFVYTGFRPRYVMIKNSTTGGAGYDWFVWDSVRDTYNLTTLDLNPNSSQVENTNSGDGLDILSNGFKIRVSAAATNTNGNTFIYAAFAESPFKYSLAR